MSEIKSLVSEFNNMCGESSTEMGDAALAELDRLRKIEIAATAITKSFECYAATNKPEIEWDEYDTWMYPLWNNLLNSLGLGKGGK